MVVQTIFMTPRQSRGFQIARTSRLRKRGNGWLVPSQSGKGCYFVEVKGHDYNCTCPDCQFNKQRCKHIFAVEYWVTRSVDMNGKEAFNSGMRVTYAQQWPAYNKAQCEEKPLFMELLANLCSGVEQPAYDFGRPKLSLADMIYCSVFKVYSTFSGRRFTGDMKTAKEKGYIDKVPHYNSVFNYLQKPEFTKILKELIVKSSLPLRSVETNFAVDSTGFSTCHYARWFNFKYGREQDSRIWLKAHVMCGVKTNIVTSIEISKGTANDSTFFEPLVNQMSDNFDIEEISADKAYSSKKNLEVVRKCGGVSFIPFKKNIIVRPGRTKGSPLWRKMWHYFNLHREEFLDHYHKRSNVESTMNMIKSKFGGRLRSKTNIAQVNELLAKVLCHNICVVIQEMHELGYMPHS